MRFITPGQAGGKWGRKRDPVTLAKNGHIAGQRPRMQKVTQKKGHGSGAPEAAREGGYLPGERTEAGGLVKGGYRGKTERGNADGRSVTGWRDLTGGTKDARVPTNAQYTFGGKEQIRFYGDGTNQHTSVKFGRRPEGTEKTTPQCANGQKEDRTGARGRPNKEQGHDKMPNSGPAMKKGK